jgi:hypothetical protein
MDSVSPATSGAATPTAALGPPPSGLAASRAAASGVAASRAAASGAAAAPGAIDAVGERLARLLTDGDDRLRDPQRGDLVFEDEITIEPLEAGRLPPDAWAVDGGQALVADARCLQVYVTRAATVRWRDGSCVVEDEGDLVAHLLGGGDERLTLLAQGAPVAPDCSVDVNLLRDWGEWAAVATAVAAAERGAVVLVDGDLLPDWRLAPTWVAGLLEEAGERGVLLAGVTKHSSLARGSAPLLGILERRAEDELGPRQRWWARVATTRPEAGPGLTVTMARLDPDARFAFRIDLPGDVDPAPALGGLAALADDAAFPGYPYPLSVADRLAACPRWVRDDVWDHLQDVFDRAGVPGDVRDRAFADRHRLMERS